MLQIDTRQSALIGDYIYLKKAFLKSDLSKLERGAINIDPRFSSCSKSQAEQANIKEEDCVMKSVLSLRVAHVGIKYQFQGIDMRFFPNTTGEFSIDRSVNSENTNLIIVDVESQMRDFNYIRNINLTDKLLLSKNEDLDLDAEYLYVPSTHDAPKDMAAADPFFQGSEKIVKLKLSEEGLNVYEIEDDEKGC